MVSGELGQAQSGKATTATAALEQALIARFGSLGRVNRSFLLRSDNDLVFTSRAYTRMMRSYTFNNSSSCRTVRSKTGWSSG